MLETYTPAWMSEDLAIFQDAVKKFYEREFLPHNDKWIKQGMVDRDAWTKAGAAGLLCASVPEEFGGAGGTYAHEAILAEEMERVGISSWGNAVHSTICAHYFLAYGTDEQKQRWLPKMATGELVCAIAMTEPGTGSDLQAVKTTARKQGDQYIINGAKTFITNGQQADIIIVVAKTDNTQGAKGISLIVVEASMAGFRRGRNLDKLGQHAADTSELFFDDVAVPLDNLIGGEEGQGFYMLMKQLPQERLIIANQAVAAIERAITLTLDYTKQRTTFGKTVFDYQNTQFKLAECKADWMAARSLVDGLTMRLLEGTLDANTAAAAKFWCTERQCAVIDTCLQFFGGFGYMDEYPISRMYADARVQKIYGGANEIMRMLVARSL